MLRPTAWLVAVGLALGAATPGRAGDMVSAGDLLSPELKAMQADDGANPGMLWVEQGAGLWRQPAGSAGKSCAACHGDAAASMKGVAARYPAVDAPTGKLMNIELRINACRETHMHAPPLAYESNELLALTAYIAFQSRGMPLAVRVDGPAAPHLEAGKAFFFRREGQLNVACNQCHDDNVGRRLRGDRISSGLPTGYPAYRLEWQTLGSLHRRLRACSLGVRAHQFPPGAPEYVDLELYLASRAAGRPIEAPGVRK